MSSDSAGLMERRDSENAGLAAGVARSGPRPVSILDLAVLLIFAMRLELTLGDEVERMDEMELVEWVLMRVVLRRESTFGFALETFSRNSVGLGLCGSGVPVFGVAGFWILVVLIPVSIFDLTADSFEAEPDLLSGVVDAWAPSGFLAIGLFDACTTPGFLTSDVFDVWATSDFLATGAVGVLFCRPVLIFDFTDARLLADPDRLMEVDDADFGIGCALSGVLSVF